MGLILLAMKLMLSAQSDLVQNQTGAGLLHKAVDPSRHKLILTYFLSYFRVFPDPILAGALIFYLLAQWIAAAWRVFVLRDPMGTNFPSQLQASPWLRIITAPFSVAPEMRKAVVITILVLATALLGFYTVYLFTPIELSYHLGTSLDRVIVQIWPSLVFLIFLVLRSPSDLTGEESGIVGDFDSTRRLGGS